MKRQSKVERDELAKFHRAFWCTCSRRDGGCRCRSPIPGGDVPALLAQGYGFSEKIIWQYLDDPQGIPTPSHTYWMPLTSILAAAGYAIQDNFRAAQIPFWLLSGFLPLLSYDKTGASFL